MKLIAKKPCSFGGRKFFIDQEIPAGLVAEPEVQVRLGVITVVRDGEEGILAEGIMDISAFDGKVVVPVVNRENGDTEERMAVPLTEGGVQQVFSIMQMNIPDAEKAIGEVTEENILIVLHACDSRAKIRKAAKNRADIFIPIAVDSDTPLAGNEATDHIQEDDNRSCDQS